MLVVGVGLVCMVGHVNGMTNDEEHVFMRDDPSRIHERGQEPIIHICAVICGTSDMLGWQGANYHGTGSSLLEQSLALLFWYNTHHA